MFCVVFMSVVSKLIYFLRVLILWIQKDMHSSFLRGTKLFTPSEISPFSWKNLNYLLKFGISGMIKMTKSTGWPPNVANGLHSFNILGFYLLCPMQFNQVVSGSILLFSMTMVFRANDKDLVHQKISRTLWRPMQSINSTLPRASTTAND